MAIPEAPGPMIENRTFDEIAIGDSASVSRTVSQRDIDLCAVVSGDVNPAHMDPAYAETDMFHKVIAHGMIGAGLISNVLGAKLPGPGTLSRSGPALPLSGEHGRHHPGDSDGNGEAA
jgi:acyl dehydratase